MTSVPRGVTARQFIRALQADGFELRKIRGSHHIYGNVDGRRVVVAYHHAGDTFPIGTLRAMINGADWKEEDLRRLSLAD